MRLYSVLTLILLFSLIVFFENELGTLCLGLEAVQGGQRLLVSLLSFDLFSQELHHVLLG